VNGPGDGDSDGPFDGDGWVQAGEDPLDCLIGLLTDVDEFLRTPGTAAVLEEFYRVRRGSAFPG
jgi:hypothetical protein